MTEMPYLPPHGSLHARPDFGRAPYWLGEVWFGAPVAPTVYLPMEPPRDMRPAALRRETAADVVTAWRNAAHG